METEILGGHQEYVEEKFEEVLLRYNRFGKDIYAIYNNGNIMFAIQFDPDCEVICLYNKETQIEIGNWNNNDYYKQSVEFIRTEFLHENL